jgi:hypothetical protein
LSASANLPSEIAPTDRVVPQEGHGIPMKNLIGQRIGPSVKPLESREISRIRIIPLKAIPILIGLEVDI